MNIPHGKSSVSDYITVSVGAASIIPDINFSYEDLFKLADKALYLAKDAGRNQVKYLDESDYTEGVKTKFGSQ